MDQKRAVESIQITGTSVEIDYGNAKLVELESTSNTLDDLTPLTESLYTDGEHIFAKSDANATRNDAMTIHELIDDIIVESSLLEKLPIEYDRNEVDLKFYLEMTTSGLKIAPYRIKKGDLDNEFIIYKNWLYVLDEGLYKLHSSRLKNDLKKHRDIPLDEVSDFIRKNKLFLTSHDGFRCFEKPFCEDLLYAVNDKSELTFYHEALTHNQASNKDVIQFNNWIYIEDYGFFQMKFTT